MPNRPSQRCVAQQDSLTSQSPAATTDRNTAPAERKVYTFAPQLKAEKLLRQLGWKQDKHGLWQNVRAGLYRRVYWAALLDSGINPFTLQLLPANKLLGVEDMVS